MGRVAAIIAALLLLAGCRTTRLVEVEAPVPVVLRDTIQQARELRDTICIRDSVHVDGTTIYKERTIYKSKLRTDTIYIVRTDTISVPRAVLVDKPLGKASAFFLSLGKASAAALLLLLGLAIVKRKF